MAKLLKGLFLRMTLAYIALVSSKLENQGVVVWEIGLVLLHFLGALELRMR